MQDHGGNRREAAEAYGVSDVLDFSASINLLGHPPGLRERVAACWDEVLHYPDRGAPRLVSAISRAHSLPEDRILVGNGSAELIELVLRTVGAGRLVLSPPDFSLYEELAPQRFDIARVPRAEATGFALDRRRLSEAIGRGDLVLFSNPGNPSGSVEPRQGLLDFIGRCEAAGACVVVDEAFVDFCPTHSLLREAGERPNLVVLRSLTKFYGIPGLRLGFAVGPPEIVRPMAASQVPWSVNAVAQVAGIHCLGCLDWPARSLAAVTGARQALSAALATIPGLRPLPSRANYLLVEVRPPSPSAGALYQALARRGILIRHCGSFGLGERFIRVAVRTAAENELLAEALRQVSALRAPACDL